MFVTVYGKLSPNEGGVVGGADRMRAKFPARRDVQMMGMNFQTHSNRRFLCLPLRFCFLLSAI